MKILHTVESYYPAIGGMQEVVKQLSERLAKLGHELIVATRKHPHRNFKELNGVKIVDFDIEGNLAGGIKGELKEYQQYLMESDADVITFFAAQQWATDAAFEVMEKIKAKKVSVPTGYSGLYNPAFSAYFENMKGWIKHYDQNVYLSHHYRDIDFARSCGVKKLTVIPNGAGEDEFLPPDTLNIRKKLNIPANHFLVLLVGSYTGWKGHKEALEIFLRSDLKQATLLMIGNNYEYFKRQYVKHPELAWLKLRTSVSSKRVIFNHFTRAETVSAYKQANLFLFPSNIECSPIVLFEAMASKTPFLTTDVGNSPEIIDWSGGGILMPTQKDENGFSHANIKDSVKLLNTLYTNKEKCQQLAEAGFRTWKEKFSWEKITRQYEDLYATVIKQH